MERKEIGFSAVSLSLSLSSSPPLLFFFLNQIRSILFSSLHTGNSTRAFLNGPNWDTGADWLEGKAALVLIPLRRPATEGPLGLQAAETRQATKYLFSVALLRPHQTAFLLNLAPKLLGLGLVWLLKEK